VCAAWRAQFEQTGVTASDLDELGRFIDRPGLVAEREAFLRSP
jgi:hypothetical protein